MAEETRGLNASHLTEEEQAAVQRAMEAVVERDVDRARTMLDASRRDAAEDFWMWADDYGDERRLALAMPPGSVESWNIDGVRMNDGGFALDLEVWATSGRTDLTLQLALYLEPAGTPRVELRDLHVL